MTEVLPMNLPISIAIHAVQLNYPDCRREKHGYANIQNDAYVKQSKELPQEACQMINRNAMKVKTILYDFH